MKVNQYADSFKNVIQTRYKLPIDKAMETFSFQRLSCDQVAELTGFKKATIQKYCRKYDIELNPSTKTIEKLNDQYSLYQLIRSKKLNKINIFTRQWR